MKYQEPGRKCQLSLCLIPFTQLLLKQIVEICGQLRTENDYIKGKKQANKQTNKNKNKTNKNYHFIHIMLHKGEICSEAHAYSCI